MKPAISYYGGKQRIASKIIPHIPRHTVYVEPFSGGATIFWKKKTPKITNNIHYQEVLNDIDGSLINFYRVLQDRKKYEEFQKLLDNTLYHEEEHKKAKQIYNDKNHSDIRRAWAYFVNIQMGFSNVLNSGFSYNNKSRNFPITWNNKKVLHHHHERIEKTTIHNRDALDLIKMYDAPQTFFYLDPPYPEASQGHYSGYTIDDYIRLIETLKTLKGSFILSCYSQGCEPENWKRVDIETHTSASNSNNGGHKDKRTESIWIVDNGGGIDQEYFRKIYSRPEFEAIWKNCPH